MKQWLFKAADFLSSLFFPRKGRKKLLNHLSLIILSLLMGYCLWLIAMFTVMTSQALNIPVITTNRPLNASVSIESPASGNINVMVNIPKNLVATVNTSNFIYQLDLANISSQITRLETVQEFPVSPPDVKIVNLPDLITISEVIPRSVRLRINYYNKKVPVRINVEGEPLTGFYFEKEELSSIPSEITVIATPQILQGLEYLETYPINISGRAASFTQNVALNLPSNVTVFEPPSRIEAFVAIHEEISEMAIPFVPVRFEMLRDEFITSLEPSEAKVIIKGPQSMLPQITAEDISILLTVPEEVGTFERGLNPVLKNDLPAHVLSDVSVVSSEPGTVMIENILFETEEEESEEETVSREQDIPQEENNRSPQE